MNELEVDFEFIPLGKGGLFTPENRCLYEFVIRRRGKEGWWLCQSSLVTAIDEAGKNPQPGIYATFTKMKKSSDIRDMISSQIAGPIPEIPKGAYVD